MRRQRHPASRLSHRGARRTGQKARAGSLTGGFCCMVWLTDQAVCDLSHNEEAVVARDRITRMESHPARHNGAIGVRWFYALLLALIAIAAVAGIVSTAAMGQTPVAIAIGIVTLAFFSRIGC